MISERIKELRQGVYTQAEFARAVGVVRSTVNGWESGRRTPDLDTLRRIAKALDVKVSELIEDSE